MGAANLVAAQIHKKMCYDTRFGYSQSERWGATKEKWNIGGKTVSIGVGDYDCSSSTITAWRLALVGTKYEGKLDAATYTGNMRSVFLASGLFEWKPMSFLAHTGDLYLNEGSHVSMCQTQYPDKLSEFCSNEFGGIYGGQRGDQTGGESRVAAYYDYPWDGILHYNGKADGPVTESQKSAETVATPKSTGDPKAIHFRVSTDPAGLRWLPEMWGHHDTGGSDDDYGGEDGMPIRFVAIKDVKQYRVACLNEQTGSVYWLPWVSGYNINDLDMGCAGDGSPIVKLQVDDSKARYAVGVIGGGVYDDMIGLRCVDPNEKDDFAGDGETAIDRLFMNWA